MIRSTLLPSLVTGLVLLVRATPGQVVSPQGTASQVPSAGSAADGAGAQASSPPSQGAAVQSPGSVPGSVPGSAVQAREGSLVSAAPVGSVSVPPATSFRETINRALAKEHALVTKIKTKQPVVETYIQEIKKDSELGDVPITDYYFLGKLDLDQGFMHQTFLPQPNVLKRLAHVMMTPLLAIDFFPRGFAYMIFIDQEAFDNEHYNFTYVRREFLGDVRCVVADVVPKKGSGKGRFEGRIWIEDRDYNVVRFNGTYVPAEHSYSHFDSWRVNTGPGLWLPAFIYSQEESYGFGPMGTPAFRAQTRLWNYEPQSEKIEEAFTNMTVDVPQGVKDQSETAAENSPVQSQRLWERQAEDNVVDRLERAGLIAPKGEVDQVLDTVLNNLEVTNHLPVIDPPVRVRVLLTTPLESVPIGHTIVLSRGLIDVLPDEASLAAIIAQGLAHILLGHSMNTEYAFADRLLFDDPKALKDVSVARTFKEEQAADEKAIQLLKSSPYGKDLPKVGLFLRMLSARGNDVPHLIRPLIGNRMAKGGKDLRLSGLMELSPELKVRDVNQIAALPLGSRIKMDAWSDQLTLMKTQSVPLIHAREKLPFEITPFMIHLTREQEDAVAAAASAEANAAANTTANSNSAAKP